MGSAPTYQYLDSTGTIVADTSSLLGETQAEYQLVFGADLIVKPSTPQGVLITAETLARNQVVNNNAALANQINPNIAGGVFLDAIGGLTGIQRNAQTQTVVTNVTLTGVPTTFIPAGSQASTVAGDQFGTLADVTLGSSGTAQVNFASMAYGAIPCASNALNTIVSAVLGWETVVNNPSSTPASTTTLGTTTQADSPFRAYRSNTLAFQTVSLPEAITSALYATPGVTSLSFRENTASTTQTIDGISMVGKSVYACVNGGSDLNVASALLENKSSGSAWNGGTTVSIVEPASGQTYAVKFDRPTQIGILVRVTTPNGNAANITQSVLDYANGVIPNLPGFVVGSDVSPFEIACAIINENVGTTISKVEISLESMVDYTTDDISIGLNQIAQTQASYVSVVIT